MVQILRMKTLALTFAATLAFAAKHATADCLDGGLVLEGVQGCSYEALLTAYTREFNDPVYSCSDTTAEADLWRKLGNAQTLAQAQAYVTNSICTPMYNERGFVPFTEIAARGTDYAFEKNYFNGYTTWNEQVETLYGINGLGQVSQNLKADSIGVTSFFAGDGSSQQVEFPSHLSNFQSCASNSAMCCWVTDRQAGDNNGNCATPYDLNCVDKNPGDNTDLCYVDHKSSNMSKGNGEELFPFDDNNNSDDAEGPVHCHGFAWANDPNDFTSRYKGNNLFYVSMYDHMNQRGYVRAVPGAPMCGCTEQMPVVSRSDCTQINPNEQITFSYLSGNWVAETVTSSITFAACQGYRGNNNNLFAYMQRLYYVEKKITSSQLAAVNKVIVGDNNCASATAYFMQQKGYQTGFNGTLALPSSAFTQVGGGGGFQMERPGADLTFSTLYNSSQTGIVLRICGDCAEPQRRIFVRYLPGFRPPNAFFMWLKSNKPSDYSSLIGLYGQKWAMYSTYDDALSRTNAWTCSYNNATMFPGDCDPLGTRKDQGGQLESSSTFSGKRDIGWYVDAPSIFIPASQRSFGGLFNFTSLNIGDVGVTGEGSFDVSTNGSTFIRGAGNSYGGTSDRFYFVSHQVPSGNITLTTRVRNFESIREQDALTCLIIRKSLRPGSASFEVCVYGRGNFTQLRRELDDGMKRSSTNTVVCSTDCWLRVIKTGIRYTSQISFDGIVWNQTSSVRTIPNMTSSTYYVGVGVTSRTYGYLVEASVDNYQWAVNQTSTRRLTSLRGNA